MSYRHVCGRCAFESLRRAVTIVAVSHTYTHTHTHTHTHTVTHTSHSHSPRNYEYDAARRLIISTCDSHYEYVRQFFVILFVCRWVARLSEISQINFE